jgi:hypothetical protein
LFIVFCQTPPVIQELSPEATGVIPLEPGGLAYVFVDTKKAAPILEYINIEGLDKKSFQQILDMTNFAAAAVYPRESGKRFRLAALGGYPVSNLKLALGMNRDWKKYRAPVTKAEYWYSSKMQLSVAFNPRQAFLLSTELDSAADQEGNLRPSVSVEDPFNTQSTEVPDGFGEFVRGAVISGWHERPGEVITQKLHETGIPLEIPAERLFISLFQAEGQTDEILYEARVRIQVQNALLARMIASFLAIARNSVSPNTNGFTDANDPALLAAVLFANTPVTDGNNIEIKTGTLNGREIALLFELFSL